MGVLTADALIVSGSTEAVTNARRVVMWIAGTVESPPHLSRWTAPEWEGLVSTVVQGVTNDEAAFLVGPDGSKEYWEASRAGNGFRRRIIDALGDSVTVVQVRWGDGGDRIQVGGKAMEACDE